MLSVRLTNIYGKVMEEVVPVGITFCRDEDVPADSLELVLDETDFEELVTVELFEDGVRLFSGEVDEQIKEVSKYPHTELVARSSAAKLIDNEAYPMTLINPSSEDIFNYFAKPLGFTKLVGKPSAYQGVFTISKGMSCFAVIKRFALAVYSAFPRAEEDVLYIEGKKQEEEFDAACFAVENLRTATLRHSRISQVYLKLKEGEGYTSVVKDADACSKKISRVRYLNVTSGSSSTPADADIMLKTSSDNSFYATLSGKGFFADAAGKRVKGILPEESLYVSAVKCTLTKNGERTRLTLRRKEN